MKMSSLYAKTKSAISQYNMIENGDCIAVGISGGKDSLTLLHALNGLSKQKGFNFEIRPVIVHMGFDNFDISPLCDFISSLGLNLTVIETNLAKVIFYDRKEKNPCSLCSKMRRGILNNKLKELGCNKLALGHHRDDMITTAMLSLFFEGRYHSIEPVSYMSKADITLIRPLLFISEEEIVSIVKKLNLPIVDSPCPVDKTTKRREMESFLNSMEDSFPMAKNRIFTALKSSDFLKHIKNPI